MLTLCDRSKLGRREFLQIGSLALGGMSLDGLLSARAEAAGRGKEVNDRSVIFIFQHGGPTQIETFDPKMTAPVGIRSVIGETSTTIPGVTFGSALPKLAALAHKFSVVRSYKAGDASHNIKPIVCPDTMEANMGSLYSRIAGINHPQTGMPTNAALFPRSVDMNCQEANNKFGKFASTGEFGAAYAPFIPGAGGSLQKDMKLELPMDRLDDRRFLLGTLDRARWAAESDELLSGLDHMREQAFSTILGGVADAFDLSKESPSTVERYDTSKLIDPRTIRTVWNNHKNYKDNAKTLGKLLLMARRLCEAGCGFVTVTTNFVWDMHADKNNATINEGMHYMGLPFDHAVSALIEDIEARGLSDKIMVVATGEMGRTPKVNKNGGRDHWGNLTPLMIYGGGTQGGQVIGQSTRDAGEPQTEPMQIKNLVATVMHSLFDIGKLRLVRGVPTDVLRTVSGSKPIPGLI